MMNNALRQMLAACAILVAFFALSSLSTTATADSGLIINSFPVGTDGDAGVIINRAAGARGRAGREVALSGSGASHPLDVRCEFVGSGVAVDWTALSNMQVRQDGTWSGSVNLPLSEDWLRCRVRDQVTGAKSAEQATKWGVGINWLFIGQSNLSRAYQVGKATIRPSEKTQAYSRSGWHTLDARVPPWDSCCGLNDNARIFVNTLSKSCRCLVGMMTYALSGTGLQQWISAANGGIPGSNNVWDGTLMLSGDGGVTPQGAISRAGIGSSLVYGHDFEGAIWQQGEENPGASSAAYFTGLTKIKQQLQAITGRNANDMAFGVVLIGSAIGPTIPETYLDGVRQADLQFIDHHNGFFAGTLLPATHEGADGVHGNEPDYRHLFHQITQATLKASGLADVGAYGPSIATASMPVNSNVVTVTVHHDAGTKLQDVTGNPRPSRINGFRVFVNGQRAQIMTAQIAQPSSIQLQLAQPRAGADKIQLDYGYGSNPGHLNYAPGSDIQNQTYFLYDDFPPGKDTDYPDTVGTPLQPTRGFITVEPN